MFAKFLSPAARTQSKQQGQEERTKKAPPQRLDIGKKATPDRWRPMIGAGDEEFKEVWEMFSNMRQAEDVVGLDDILEKHFTPHEAALFIPADRQKTPGIAYIQRQAGRRYHKLIKTSRFSGLKQASSAEVMISKLTMLYFGLPIAPYSFISFDDQVNGEEHEDGINYETFELVHSENRPLRFLNKYTERSHGKDISRRPDPLYENYYSGLSELQWAGHIPYEIPSFSDLLAMTSTDPFSSTKTGLRGGAGSRSELAQSISRRAPSRPGSKWRLYGWQGQIVIGDKLTEFQSAVDRLLGFTVRDDCTVILNRFNKATGELDNSLVFKTGSKEERNAFKVIRKTADPGEKLFVFFLATPQELAPGIGSWYPDKKNKNIVKIRVKGEHMGNCAYLYLPRFNRDTIGANEYNDVFAAAARILFAPLALSKNTPAVLPSIVALTFAHKNETPLRYSYGGLNTPQSVVSLLQFLAQNDKSLDIFMVRGPSFWEDDIGLFIPGSSYKEDIVEDNDARQIKPAEKWSLARYNCAKDNRLGSAADVLRNHLVTRFTPGEIDKIGYVEVWAPGEAILDPKSIPKIIRVNVVDGDNSKADEALDKLLKHARMQRPDDLSFFSTRPAYESGHKAFLKLENEIYPPLETGGGKHPQCFSFKTDITVEQFRRKVKRAIVNAQDTKFANGAILIRQNNQLQQEYTEMSQSQRSYIDLGAKIANMDKRRFMKKLQSLMKAGRNDYVVQPHTTEEEWEIIKRFITSREVFVSMVKAWSAPEGMVKEVFGCFMPRTVETQQQDASAIFGEGTDKERAAFLLGETIQIDSGSDSDIASGSDLGFDPNPLFVSRSRESGSSGRAQSTTDLAETGRRTLASNPSASNNRDTAITYSQKPAASKRPALGGNIVPSGAPPLQGKWPLTDAERVKFLREQTYGNPISCYDGGRPHVPINAPPLETFLHGGAGLPSVSIGMMTLTEQRRLQEMFVQMRNLALERTMPCPYRPCAYTFGVDKLDDVRAHIESTHASDNCNFCSERLYKHWSPEKRLQHYNTKHSNMLSLSEATGALNITQGQKEVRNDKGKKAVTFEAAETPAIVITGPTEAASTRAKPAKATRGTPRRSPEPSRETAASSSNKSKRVGTPGRRGDDGEDDDDEEEDEDEEDDYEDYDDEYDDDFVDKERTPKRGGRNARLLASAQPEITPTSSAKKKSSAKRKTGEKDSRYRDDGDTDDLDEEVAEIPAAAPASSRGKKRKASRRDPGLDDAFMAAATSGRVKKRKVSHREPESNSPDWADSANSDDYSILSEDDEPGLAAARRRELFRLRAESDPNWRPGGHLSGDDDDAELEASAVPEGEDSVLADIVGETEAGSAAKKRSPLADPSYRLPKGAQGDDDDPALIRSAVPEPGLPGILIETPTKKRKRPEAAAKSADAAPGGTGIEVTLQETASQDVEPAPKRARATPAAKKTAAATRKTSGTTAAPKTPSKAKAAPTAKSTAKKPAAENPDVEKTVEKPAPAPKTTGRAKPTPAKRKRASDDAPVRRSTRAVSKEIQ